MMQHQTIFINQPRRQIIDITSEVIVGPSPIEIYEKQKILAAEAERIANEKVLAESAQNTDQQDANSEPPETEASNE